MDYSPTRNVDNSVHRQSWSYSRLSQQIVSSAEKRTAMVGRIYMLSSIFAESTELETCANSMLRVSIQISFLQSEVLVAVGITQRKMATYVAGACADQNLARVLMLNDRMLDGTNSEMHQLERSFLNLRQRIFSAISSNHSIHSLHTQIGSLEWIDHLIVTLANTRSILHNMVRFGNGLGEHLSGNQIGKYSR